MRSALAMVSSPILLIPAYGKQYSSVEDMRAAWESGKDFLMYGHGQYTSIRDIKSLQDHCSSLTITNGRGITYCVPLEGY